MPKPVCPKCESHRAKRYCPALDQAICSPCCGEHRLVTIDCPPDCEYLEGEKYQTDRRRQRAQVRGREFFNFIGVNFPQEGEARECCMHLQADAYFFMHAFGALTNGEASQAFRDVPAQASKILVAGSSPGPLSKYLYDRLENSARYQHFVTLSKRDRVGIIEDVVRSIVRLGEPDSQSYWGILSSFFKNVSLEIDLHFDPTDAAALQTVAADRGDPVGDRVGRDYRRSSGGLILPSDN